jgi:hypothetical protein
VGVDQTGCGAPRHGYINVGRDVDDAVGVPVPVMAYVPVPAQDLTARNCRVTGTPGHQCVHVTSGGQLAPVIAGAGLRVSGARRPPGEAEAAGHDHSRRQPCGPVHCGHGDGTNNPMHHPGGTGGLQKGPEGGGAGRLSPSQIMLETVPCPRQDVPVRVADVPVLVQWVRASVARSHGILPGAPVMRVVGAGSWIGLG